MKFGRGINLILRALVPLFILPLHAETEWQAGLLASYSVATMPQDTLRNYGLTPGDASFFDYGGKLARRVGPGYLGLNMGVYTSLASRQLISASAPVVPTFTAEQSAQLGTAVSFDQGSYRLALAWSAAQLRYRYMLFDGLFFIEAGGGPAYGSGAAEAQLSGIASGGTVSANRYHKYSEWGALVSAAAGIGMPLTEDFWLEFSLEAAWLWARIRNPDISQSGTYLLSQFFFRPTLGLTLRF